MSTEQIQCRLCNVSYLSVMSSFKIQKYLHYFGWPCKCRSKMAQLKGIMWQQKYVETKMHEVFGHYSTKLCYWWVNPLQKLTTLICKSVVVISSIQTVRSSFSHMWWCYDSKQWILISKFNFHHFKLHLEIKVLKC